MNFGDLEHEFYFSILIGNVIIPTDFHIFQRGRYTTNQLFFWWVNCSDLGGKSGILLSEIS